MNIKKIIIILSILLIIILIVLVTLLLYFNHKEKFGYDLQTNDIPVETITAIEKVDTINDYFMVKSCIEKYFSYCTKTNMDDYRIIDEETMKEDKKIKSQAVYDMLNDKYIKYKNITVDNIFNQIQQIEESTVIIDDMYVSQKDINMSAYIVYGKLRDNKTKEKKDFQLILEIDMLNRTFSVIHEDYIKQNIGEIVEGNDLNFELAKSIQKNSYNTFDYKNITNEEYATEIFDDLKNNMMNDHESAYRSLEQKYSKKRFSTYKEFDNYADRNARKSLEMQLSKYQITNKGDYTQYTCIDQNGNYYIFYVTGIMDYAVILDTYTIDLPEFIEKYNNSTDAEKVLLNIQKVFSAINDGDYRYVYNKLDPTFKQTNFPTETDFEKYAKQNFYANNSIGYSNYKTSGDLHIYEVSIKDKKSETNPTKTKNFIMQLKEGTDFVMSFNVE